MLSFFESLVNCILKNFVFKVSQLVESLDCENQRRNPIPFENGIYYEYTQIELISYFNILVVFGDEARVLLLIKLYPDYNFAKSGKNKL